MCGVTLPHSQQGALANNNGSGSGEKPHDVDFHEATTDPVVADVRNFYKVERWTRDGTKVDGLLYTGSPPCLIRSIPGGLSKSM